MAATANGKTIQRSRTSIQELLLCLPHGAVSQYGSFSTVLPGRKNRAGLEVEHSGHESAPIWDTPHDGGSAYSAMVPAP